MMKHVWKRITAALLCLLMLAGFALVAPPTEAEARNYGVYEDVAKVYDQGSCPSMQGMSVHGSYVYACKINGDTDASAVVARVHKDTGSTSYLTNASTGTIYFSDFGHGNDIEVETVAGVTTLFVPTSKSGSGSLVRYAISGTTATKVGSYTMTNGGSNISGGAIRVMHYDDENITFLFKSGKYCFTGTLPISQTSGTLEMTKLCTLDYSSCYVNGTYKDTSSYSLQGMGYYDYKLYLPLSGHTVSGHENISIILVYDLEGASGTIKPDPDLTFCITSSYYGALFELESCEISPKDNRMYFSANRRRTSSDTNHDGVSYISNWTYDPSARTTEVNNYRWEQVDGKMVSVTDGGNVYNGIQQLEGKISGGTITDGRFTLSKNVVLEHDRPWILEWKSSGSGSAALLFATAAESSVANMPYIFRRTGSSLISMGYHDGSQYNNYGVDLADHGIDGTAEHIYRMTNKIASDGSNMVYLSVDGQELGPMNNYHIAGTDQGTTSDWISGQDFKFSYIGTPSHKISNCQIDYIQVWGDGLASQMDEPNTYRWESGMTTVSDYGLTPNTATLVSGSTSGSTYTDCRYDLERDIVLMHDRPWVVEWDNAGTWNGGAMLLAADHMSNTLYAPYLFRSGSIIALGQHNGTNHEQWGVRLSDYGVDINAAHTYAIKNLLNADGTNEIWLYVDGEKLAPMTTYCKNGSVNSSAPSYNANGWDMVFSHMGTYQHDINGGMAYLQVWENGKPEEDQANNYRWETQNDTLISITNDTFEENPATLIKGDCADGVYSGSQLALEKPVLLRHDRHWRLEWQCEGAWSGGGLFLSSSLSSYETNNMYLFRNSGVIALGQYTGSSHEQWGVCPGDYGIDHSALHTYTLVNKIASDGSNMVYMYVDGEEVGPMNTVCVNGTQNGETADWVSGKDFLFAYLGTDEHTVNDTTLTYLQVFEGCEHSYGDWAVTAATCTADGSQTRSCSICGNVETQVIPATGHAYDMTATDGSCVAYEQYCFTCSACGDSYSLDAGVLASDWIDYIPAGMDEGLFNAKTQYRYSDYQTQTSYETALEGYTLKSSAWDQSGSGAISYVNSWPSGFSTSSSLYTQYNKKSSKVTASETATDKTVVDSDEIVGYLYYHWCYSNSYYSAASQSGSYTTFHAYYSTTAPSSYTCDTSDMSYCTAHSTCSNSEWFFVAEVYQQSYTQYRKLFTYERWTDFTDWQDTAVTASDTRKVETRTVYQLKEASLGDHSYTAKVTAPTCTADGYTTYTCACGDTYTADEVAANGHSFVDGVCTVCGEADPDYVEPVVQPTIALKYPTLSFEDEILLNVYYSATELQDVVQMGLVIYSTNVSSWNVDSAEEVVPGYTYNEAAGYYISTTNGIPAKCLGDTMYFAVYAELNDGSYLYSKLVSYSPKSYAYTQLSAGSADVKPLMVALLNYGAAAQTFFGYNTANLVNADLTADQKALIQSYSADMMDAVVNADSSKVGIFTNSGGFSKKYPTISFEGAFSINYYFTPANTPSGPVRMYYWTEADYNGASTLSSTNATGCIYMEDDGTGLYHAVVEGIAAKDLDSTIYVSADYMCDSTAYCTGVLAYSIGSYCVTQSAYETALQPFAQATAVYGYYAKQLFYAAA